MKIAVIGLGTMGSAIALKLIDNGHEVLVYDIDKSKSLIFKDNFVSKEEAYSAETIWLMLPAGKITNSVAQEIIDNYGCKNKIIIDGGNSFYKDSINLANRAQKKDISFLDCGVSGGSLGYKSCYCLMVGGKYSAYLRVEAIFRSLAYSSDVENAYKYLGLSGSGHYAKMVHNGIEYSLLQAYAEGFDLLNNSQFNYNLEEISSLYNTGSLISSTLLGIFTRALKTDWENISGVIGGGQTGKWAYDEGVNNNIQLPALKTSLSVRKWSQDGGNQATKLISKVRNIFGEHQISENKNLSKISFWQANAGMQMIDVSWPISKDMTTYKDRKDIIITEIKNYKKAGVQENSISMNLHTGTHVDAPAHMSDGKSIDKFPDNYLVGNCSVIDCTHVNDQIQIHDLGKIDTEIVFLKTKNSFTKSSDSFDYNLVTLSADAASYLVKSNVKIVGIDGLSVEKNDPTHQVHKILFSAGIFIVEGLRLDNIVGGEYTSFIFPLFIQNVDAAPARVFLAKL